MDEQTLALVNQIRSELRVAADPQCRHCGGVGGFIAVQPDGFVSSTICMMCIRSERKERP